MQRCYFAVYRTLVAKQLATAHREASIKMTGRWHQCKGVIWVICEKKWDKNYSQIMSLLSPPASESGGSCPPGPMVAPPMGKGLVGYCTSGHSLNPPLLVSPIPLCVVSQTLDLENFARTSRSYCPQNSVDGRACWAQLQQSLRHRAVAGHAQVYCTSIDRNNRRFDLFWICRTTCSYSYATSGVTVIFGPSANIRYTV